MTNEYTFMNNKYHSKIRYKITLLGWHTIINPDDCYWALRKRIWPIRTAVQAGKCEREQTPLSWKKIVRVVGLKVHHSWLADEPLWNANECSMLVPANHGAKMCELVSHQQNPVGHQFAGRKWPNRSVANAIHWPGKSSKLLASVCNLQSLY